MNRSIIAGSDPEAQALIGEWAEAGCVVESSCDSGRWWHRRIDPARVRDVNFPINRIELVASLDSDTPGCASAIGKWVDGGYVIDSRPNGETWINRAGRKAAAQ